MLHSNRLRGWLAATLLLFSAVVPAVSLAPLADVAQVAAGRSSTCALSRSGTVSCWGSNIVGQLGVGDAASITVRPTPVPLPTLSGIRSLASNYGHTCAVTAERGVRCWGLNDTGQSGDATFDYATDIPVEVQGLSAPVRSVATGSSHSCALLDNGRVECWGGNGYGQLGDGGGADRGTAAAVDLPANASAIANGAHHSCAALVDGSTVCWGRNRFGQLGDASSDDRNRPVAVQGLPEAVQDFALGEDSSCALTTSGAVYCWGPPYPLIAFAEVSLTARAYPGFDSDIVAIDAGNYHICALTRSNRVKCFGENFLGQFGLGAGDNPPSDNGAFGLAADIEQISAGGAHTCARSRAGGLQCWGDNFYGQLGNDRSTQRLAPTPVSGLDSDVADIGAGTYHSCALSTDGSVKCWGSRSAALGDGGGHLSRVPAAVPGLAAGNRALAVGIRANCVITAARRAQCWGTNHQAQLGNGRVGDGGPPEPVQGLGEVDVLDIGAGRDHACALLDGGVVKCWGTNEYGQLGDGSTTLRSSAVAVAGLGSGVRALSVGWLHTCAIAADGALKCWGFNEHGQLGDGSTTHRATPVDVVGLASGAIDIAAGGVHSCSLMTGGAVKCWGAIGFGESLGNGSNQGSATPVDVAALRSGVVEIYPALFQTCVRTDTGAALCWAGIVGDNSNQTRILPTASPSLQRGVSRIGLFGGGAICVVLNGAARCWGDNAFAQIGDGTTYGEATPQTVLSDSQTRRVAALDAAANAPSVGAQFDASGRYVVFESEADNLVAGDSNAASDIFRRDRETGETVRVSVDTNATQLSGPSSRAGVSADGQLIVFVAADNAAAKLFGETAAQRDQRMKSSHSAVYLRNLLTGSTQRVGPAASDTSDPPRIAANGGTVVFTAPTSSAEQGEPGQLNVYAVALARVGDALSPGPPVCLSCKSVSTNGTSSGSNADAGSGAPVISADGQWVAYESTAGNALSDNSAPCPTGSSQILLRNLLSGTTQRISPPASLPATSCAGSGSQKPSIDYSGQTIVWQSDQPLAAGDNNAQDDVYLWQSGAAELQRLSLAGDGTDTSAAAQSPQLSGNGKQVVFVSAAPNHDLDFADNNDRVDVHSLSLDNPADIVRLSRTPNGGEIDAASQAPTLNYDGSQLAFHSAAGNLLTGVVGRTTVYTRSNPLASAKKSATWWIPSESGWGLTVFDQGNLLAPTWFTYDSDGEPTWFIVGGAFPQADGSYTGDVLRLTGTPFNQIDGPATQSVSTAGNVTLTYQGDDNLTFAYSVDGISQSKALEKFSFGSRSFTCSTSPDSSRADASNYTDLWTGAGTNAGWGLTLFHVDDLLVAIWYTYDSDGEAVFFVITTTRQADGSYSGEIYRQQNGTPFSAIDGELASPGSDAVGNARFSFADGETASFAYTVNGISQTRSINRLLVGSEGQVCRSEDAAGD